MFFEKQNNIYNIQKGTNDWGTVLSMIMLGPCYTLINDLSIDR